MCLALEPETESELIKLQLEEVEEAHRLLNDNVDLAQIDLPDLRGHLSRLASGASLSASELLGLKRFLGMSFRLRTFLNALKPDEYPVMCSFVPKLHVLRELEESIDKVIDESAAILDEASPALFKYRADLRRLTARIKEELLRIINSTSLSKCLQELIYTQRNGRYVLPVNASHRQSIEGIVHDSSASGLTVYVEPLAVVELTNRIRLIEVEIEREIDRLLLELSNKARAHLEKIDQSFVAAVESNFIWARALLAKKYGGQPVTISENGSLRLLQARHPLLILQNAKIDAVVPNDIILGGDLRTLVITGPNTGGKTVLLKTAGLLSLMLRAGLLLPVAPSSEAAILPKVIADIGDEQSLEQNLSTFSSHMGSIIDIVGSASQGSLVLLDEIGAGTDPKEGVVLARVILAELKRSGALTICSTHFGDLKTLAHQENGFLNASMEFDENTLVPTYRLRSGIPGNSRALDIARRLGLPNHLVCEAEEILLSGRQDFEIKIEEMESRLEALLKKEQAFDHKEKELKLLEETWQTKKEALEAEIKKFKEEAASSFHDELRRAKKIVSELTANLQKEPSLAKAQQAQKRLSDLKEELGWLEPPDTGDKGNLQCGQQVRIISLNQIGVIEAILQQPSASDKGLAAVLVGRMKIKVSLADLELLKTVNKTAKSDQKQKPKRHVAKSVPQNEHCFVPGESNTLDLRGKRVEEALTEVEQFVDQCYRLQLSPLMIIHGHGTGALKAAVRDYLSTCSYEAKSRPGESYEGGDGVTIVHFS